MISIHRSLKFFCRLYLNKYCKKISLNGLFLNNEIRLFATEETALKKITVRSLRPPKKHKFEINSLVLLLIPVSAFGLGTWQVFRKFEKENLNEMYLEVIKQPAVEIPKKLFCTFWSFGIDKKHVGVPTSGSYGLDELKDMEFRQVRVRGTFDHSKEIYLGPRPKIDEYSFNRPSSLFSKTNAGFLVITPFTLSDRNLTILVNRGWVPPKKKLPEFRQEGQITGEVEFVGLVRLQENRVPFGVKNKPEKGVWLYRDVEKMAELTGAAPVFIDADTASTVPGGPIGGQTLIELRNEHLSYILTWYALSTVSGYLWYLRHFQKPILV